MPDGSMQSPQLQLAGAPVAQAPAKAASERPPIRGAVLYGAIIIGLFFGGLVGWASMAPLESGAVASGSVSLDSNRKTVQHLEGGIVSEIFVRDGDQVTTGQTLITLDETQARARLEFLQAEITAGTTQLRLLGEEIGAVRTLFKKGLTQKPRLLALERRAAELKGTQGRYLAQIRAAKDVLERSTIKAPMAGTVVGLQVHSKDGVIAKGEPLLYIVPKDEPLVIEAKINPNDIDVVHQGLPAQVRLTPFNSRSTAALAGRVTSVSADSITDRDSGQDYYLARIELNEEPSKKLNGGALYPGMPAEIVIVTGQRTALDYFLAPLTRSLNRAFREN